MQTTNANKYGSANDSVWRFLAEYPLSESMPEKETGDELMAGSLFQTMRNLGIPLEYIEYIDMTLTGFAKEALAHFKQGSLELPGRIRVFCQKKLIDGASSTKTARPDHAGQTMEQVRIKYPSATFMSGGWGYFVIERSRGYPTGDCTEPLYFIDLYLYKEGE